MINVIYIFIKQLGISRISLRKITEAYEQHPMKNSIRCVSDILDEFYVPNMVCQLTLEQLREIDAPYLVMVNGSNNPLCIVERIDDEKIMLKTAKETKVYSLLHFSRIWTGVVLGAEKSDDIITEPILSYYINQLIAFISTKLFSIVIAILSTLLLIYTFSNPIDNIWHLGLTALGLIISLLVIRKTLIIKEIVSYSWDFD